MTYAQIAMTAVLGVVIALVLLIASVAAAIRKRKNSQRGDEPLADFYTGGRRTGPFVLAMTILTTYLSASSFLGGPGFAYEKGIAWAYLAAIQIPVVFLTFGIVGKKLGTVSRRLNAVTVNDVIRARYGSPVLVIFCTLAMIACYVVQMIAQIKGGAILFQTVTGLNYEPALLVFGLLVVLFTVVGGFSGQSVANTLFGILMVIGCAMLLVLLTRASSNGNVAETMTVLHPGWDAIGGADGTLRPAYVLSFWILTGFGVLGLPQTASCGTAFRDTRSLNRAIPIGTLLLAFIVLSIHIVGAYAPLLISMPEVRILLGESAGTDYVIPAIVLKYMSPLSAGFFFAAPLAAVLSSVNALFLSTSAALVKDIYVNYVLRDRERSKTELFRKRAAFVTFVLTTVLAALAWYLLRLPYVREMSIVRLNLMAMGGLECVFFCPLAVGLFWKRANAAGAVTSSVAGFALYVYLTANGIEPAGFQPVVPSLLLSILLFFAVSSAASGNAPEPPGAFFPRR